MALVAHDGLAHCLGLFMLVFLLALALKGLNAASVGQLVHLLELFIVIDLLDGSDVPVLLHIWVAEH